MVNFIAALSILFPNWVWSQDTVPARTEALQAKQTVSLKRLRSMRLLKPKSHMTLCSTLTGATEIMETDSNGKEIQICRFRDGSEISMESLNTWGKKNDIDRISTRPH